MEELMVTIRCITYNHEPFIRQCLEGFVMQKTNFRFEAIVHDDASTDGTAAIILEYAEKYPDIIKPIIETENQYSKHDGSLARIMNEHTHGKYVALCEGDDYWTDPYKLQKQVDFLESHPEYSLCFHNAMHHFQDWDIEDSVFIKDLKSDRDYTGTEILTKWIIPTASVIFRREVMFSDFYHKITSDTRIVFGDTPLFLTANHFGKLYCLNEVMSIYRAHKGGVGTIFNYETCKKLPNHYKAMLEYFGDEVSNIKGKITQSAMKVATKSFYRKEYMLCLKSLLQAVYYSPRTVFVICKEILIR